MDTDTDTDAVTDNRHRHEPIARCITLRAMLRPDASGACVSIHMRKTSAECCVLK